MILRYGVSISKVRREDCFQSDFIKSKFAFLGHRVRLSRSSSNRPLSQRSRRCVPVMHQSTFDRRGNPWASSQCFRRCHRTTTAVCQSVDRSSTHSQGTLDRYVQRDR